MRRWITSLLLLAAVSASALAQFGAGAATRCSRLIVFSWNSAAPAGGDTNALLCGSAPGRVVADGPVDFRFINPNSDEISIRYAEDDIPGKPESIKVRVNGLGINNRVVYLTRTDRNLTGNDPSWVYDSGTLSINPSAQGCLTVKAWHSVKKRVKHHGRVTVKLVKVWGASNAYHTIDTLSC